MSPPELPESPPEVKASLPIPRVPWHPWLGIVFVVVIYFLSQVFSSLLVSIYPLLRHWSGSQATNWLNNSVSAQFIYVLLAEGLTVGAIYLFLRVHRTNWRNLGLRRPQARDPFYGAVTWVVYFIVYLAVVGVIGYLIPSLNVNQHQQIGFTNVHGVAQLVLTFISLVILPPFTEEVMIRGVLYGSLKKAMPGAGAVIVTSAIFASAHLPEGGAAGPLYIAAIDTFLLSLALIYLREKTNSLWAGITLHAFKNGVAFVALFLLASR